jgi:pyrimidine operon attenuation protein/uracil phosphoribosyltransferase
MTLVERRVVMDATAVRGAVRRIAHQVVEEVDDLSTLALVGVRTRGVPLARRIAAHVAEAEGVSAPVGELDITLYRDDVFEGMANPEVRPTHLPFEMSGRHIVLVDDVLYTGRTVRAALEALMDWVGQTVDTGRDESIKVHLAEFDDEDRVVLRGLPERPGG